MDYVSLFMGLFIIGLGFLIKKYPNTLAGYNTMSAEKKKNVDIEKITDVLKKGMIIIGIITIKAPQLFDWMGLPTFANIALIAPLLIGVFILIMITQKYDHNKKSKFMAMLPTMIIGIIMVTVSIALYHGSQPTKIIFNHNKIDFTGQYGITIHKDDIKNIELLKTIPPIKKRTNGLGLGNILKGDFILEGYGRCLLYLRLPNPPFLYIELKNNKKILFNSTNPEYTVKMFEQMK